MIQYGYGSTPMVLFRGRCPTHFSLFSGDWHVHWGYGILTHGHTYTIYTCVVIMYVSLNLSIYIYINTMQNGGGVLNLDAG